MLMMQWSYDKTVLFVLKLLQSSFDLIHSIFTAYVDVKFQ